MKPCKNDPICLGGFGKKCNRDTQYHNQNRVYSSFTVAVSVTTSFLPWYLVKDEKDLECSNSRAAGNNSTTVQQYNSTTVRNWK
jgi:hypothetical protein